MTAPLFYADVVPAAGRLTITGAEAHHAGSAMRLAPGETVLVSDGRGALATCRVAESARGAPMVVEVLAVEHVAAGSPITVVQAIPKGERADLAVELLAEAGAAVVVPWASQRTVAQWRGKEAAKLERWRRVARAASKQSRRAHVLTVRPLCTGVPELPGPAFVLHEDAEECLYDLDLPAGPLTVVVGPEGGLSGGEVLALVAAGARPVRLGQEILRTSTAGAAACLWLKGWQTRSRSMT